MSNHTLGRNDTANCNTLNIGLLAHCHRSYDGREQGSYRYVYRNGRLGGLYLLGFRFRYVATSP